MISGGQGAGNLVRVGHMATSARGLYPVVGLAAVGQTLVDLGARVDVGAGVEAALAEIAQTSPAPA
jgi:pyridoxamine--pyruvate transaminase